MASQGSMQTIRRLGNLYRSQLIIGITPILLMPLIFYPGTLESKCLFVVLLMSVYWLFEVMPLAVTAMLPLFLFPMTGIMSSGTVSVKYMPDVNFLSFGGLIVALAVEKCNLHHRLALRVLTMVGSEPKWILFGFMVITAFLSMWMSNTACTAMMVPIAMSVIEEWQKSSTESKDNKELLTKDGVKLTRTGSIRSEKSLPSESAVVVEQMDTSLTGSQLSVAKCLLLGIAFASSIGGTATLTGSPTNISMVGLMKGLYPADAGRSVTYVLFTLFALPTSLVTLLLSWISLQCYFLGFKSTMRSLIPKRFKRKEEQLDTNTLQSINAEKDKVKKLFVQRYHDLPRMSFAEKSVLFWFIVLIIMWILRDLGAPGFKGFGDYFKKGYFSDATSAIIITVILFAFPSENPCRLLKSEKLAKRKKIEMLMDWATMKKRFPWDIVFLLGGGFALAAGVRDSGLSHQIGSLLSQMNALPLGVLQIICMLIAVLLTNIASNVVTCSILIPIVSGMAQKLEINPLAVVLPVTMACSYAFMLPVGTPPNAIVFGPGILKLKDMIGGGFFVSVISVLVVVVHCQSLARLYMNFDIFPIWANQTALALMTNSTSSVLPV